MVTWDDVSPLLVSLLIRSAKVAFLLLWRTIKRLQNSGSGRAGGQLSGQRRMTTTATRSLM
jgi:hypothetical protein